MAKIHNCAICGRPVYGNGYCHENDQYYCRESCYEHYRDGIRAAWIGYAKVVGAIIVICAVPWLIPLAVIGWIFSGGRDR